MNQRMRSCLDDLRAHAGKTGVLRMTTQGMLLFFLWVNSFPLLVFLLNPLFYFLLFVPFFLLLLISPFLSSFSLFLSLFSPYPPCFYWSNAHVLNKTGSRPCSGGPVLQHSPANTHVCPHGHCPLLLSEDSWMYTILYTEIQI